MWNADTHSEISHIINGVQSKVDSEGEFIVRSCIEDISYEDAEESKSEESYLSDGSDSSDDSDTESESSEESTP